MTGTYIEMVVYSFAGKKQIMGGEINFGKKNIFSEYIYIDILVQVKRLDINTT